MKDPGDEEGIGPFPAKSSVTKNGLPSSVTLPCEAGMLGRRARVGVQQMARATRMTATANTCLPGLGLAISILAFLGCSGRGAVRADADAGGDAMASSTDLGWPACTDDMAVDPNPSNGGALLLPPDIDLRCLLLNL